MSRLLVVYSTIEGQTKKIALAVQSELLSSGCQVDIVNVESHPVFDFTQYDAVIVGGSVHMTHFAPILRDWVKTNAHALSKAKSAFFSVCLGILENNPETQKAERKIVTDFFEETGWTPQHWTIFAGALKYTQYGWLKKIMLKAIAKRAGGGQDTSRDYEYTDWKAVKEFARSSL